MCQNCLCPMIDHVSDIGVVKNVYVHSTFLFVCQNCLCPCLCPLAIFFHARTGYVQTVTSSDTHSLQFIPLHYTRSDSRRLYLDKNLILYKEQCLSADPPVTPVKESMYRKIFCEEYNLSVFRPKKDQCATCTKYDQWSGEQKERFKEEYEAHLVRKTEAQDAKARDKAKAVAEKGTFVSASFDLQSVLQIPSSEHSQMYYSRKLCVYNLCIYNQAPPNEASCYCWSEVEGKRGSNDIGTCLFKWLNDLPDTVHEVSLFSDTCGGQNRNQNVAAMFLYAVRNTQLRVITHNFLESGHSHMECDSMHSAIEREKKNINVFTMHDWVNIFRKARRRLPYKVINMCHRDFYDLQNLSQQIMKNKRRDEDGHVINWLCVKSFQYRKDDPGTIYYKYKYSDDYKKIPVYGRGRPTVPHNLDFAYQEKLQISDLKKNDLIKLCNSLAIPEEFHGWYMALPSSRRVKDQLPAPSVHDTEDSDDNDVA